MTSRSRRIVFAVSTPVIIFLVLGGFLGRAMTRDGSYQHLRAFEDVVSLIFNNYVEEPDPARIMAGAMGGLADSLDPDSAFLSAEQVRRAEQDERPAELGIGIELTRQYYLRIIAVREGSAAARAGLRGGDYVRAIDGRPTRDMSVFEGARLLRGALGSTVKLLVIRGSAAEPFAVEIERARVTAPDVSSRMAAPRTGYVRVAAFGATTAEQLRSHVVSLTKAGADGFVIDVRGTAEGQIDVGLAAARLFVASGTLVFLETRGGPRQAVSAAPGDGAVTAPAIVLVDSGTSGAGELFAAALSGAKRADLVGGRTFGRAAAQKLIRLPNGTGLWLSYARYLTAAGTPIHEKGLEPEVPVEAPDADASETPQPDRVLEKALERLATKKAA